MSKKVSLKNIVHISENEEIIWRKTIKTEEIIEIIIPQKELINKVKTDKMPHTYRFLLPKEELESYESLRIDDVENRIKIAKLINLSSVPNKDIEAIQESKGLFDDLFEDEIETNVLKIHKLIERLKIWKE